MLNFSLAKILRDRLEDDEDRKNIFIIAEFQAKKNPQIDVTGLLKKQNGRRSASVGDFFSLQEKIIASGACVCSFCLPVVCHVWSSCNLQNNRGNAIQT